MTIQVAFLEEPLAANFALDLLLCVVHQEVTIQVAFHCELLPAQVALKLLLVGVDQHVTVQVTLLNEPLAALVTLIGLVARLQPLFDLRPQLLLLCHSGAILKVNVSVHGRDRVLEKLRTIQTCLGIFIDFVCWILYLRLFHY